MVSSGSIHTIMEGKAFSFLCVLLAIVAGVCAGPARIYNTLCAQECKGDQSTLHFKVGKTYLYNYEAATVSTLQGSFDEHSSIHVRASAKIEVLAPCELVLSLRDVTLENSDPRELSRLRTSDNQSAFKKALESRQLRFAFQNGRIESICAAEDEPQWSLNFKRGVLSALQNSMSHLEKDQKIKETDVAGECETDYKVSSNGWNSVTITKSKNLLGCTGRTNAITSLQSTPYTADSDIQSLPLMKSAHNCEQSVSKSGILQKSECHESHVFRPFSNKGSGAATTVRQVLTYNKEYNYVHRHKASTHRRTTLTFEHNSEMDAEKNVERVTEKLQEICSSDDIRPQTPSLFSELVFAMKSLDIYNLQSLHNQVEHNQICTTNHVMGQKFFHDALPAMGTSASVSLMQKLIVSGEVTGTEAGMWLTSLAFIAKPTKEMIIGIKPLLDNIKALLPISSMIHTFCKTVGDCQFDVDIRDIIRTLTNNLDYNCKGDRHMVLVTLKALGNMGFTSGALEIIHRCVNEANSIEVRVAAIDTYRRMSCKNGRAALESIFNNFEEDSEVRIAAYLGLMQCPTEYTISLVKNVLETEEVNQVGSFVWTHLTNIKESAGQFKQDTRDILEDETLKKTFNLDARKFSRNYEGSFFLKSFNIGAMAEGNLIWSSKSFIPRSAYFNLTVDLFGYSMNLFEFGGRIEGLESYLEAFFGPNGYFPNNAVSDVLKRQRRASTNRLTSLFNRFNAQNDELKSSAFFRMFGNELNFFDSAKKQQKEEFNFLEFLIKLAQEHQMGYTKSFMFLDSELHMPTIIGVPLKLCINGTATVDVKVGGKMDVRKAGTSPHSLDINGYIKPSGAVEISGEMTVDATFAQSGLKMVSTLHSSTELNGLIQLQESKILNVKFNMPKDQMEIIDVKTKFFVLNGEEHREQKMKNTPRVQKKACTGNGIYNILGLQLCGEASYPDKTEKEDSPYFPFNGPFNGGITLYRRDSHTSYEFMAQIEAKKERVKGATGITKVVHFAFNTPGSKVNREIRFAFNLNSLVKELSVELKSPWRRAYVKGSLEMDGIIKHVNFNADMDGQEMIYLRGKLQNEYLANGRRLIPSAELRIPGQKPFLFRGAVTSQPGKLYDAQVSIENVFSKDVLVKGSIEQQGSGERLRYNTEGEIQSPMFNSKGSGFVADKAGVMMSHMEVTYNFETEKYHNMVFSGKFSDQSKKNNLQYSANVALQSTQFSEYQFEINGYFQKDGMHLKNSLDVVCGSDHIDSSKIVVKQETQINRTEVLRMNHSMNLIIKPLNIIMSSRLAHTYGMNEMKTEGIFSYKPGKDISVNVGLKKEMPDLARIKANLHLKLPSRELRLTSNLEETAKDSFNHEIAVQWQKNAQFRTVTKYARVPVQRRHEIRTEIYPPGMDAVIVSGLAVLDPANFKTKMEAEINREMYGTTISYAVDSNNKEKAVEANLEAFCPSGHITFETKLNGTTIGYRLKSLINWDGGTKSISIHAAGTSTSSWKQMEHRVIITTPFETAQTIDITCKSHIIHERMSFTNEVKWNTHTLVQSTKIEHLLNKGIYLSSHMHLMSPSQVLQINGELKANGLNNVQLQASLQTPYKGFEAIFINASYSQNQKVINSKITVSEPNSSTIELSSHINTLKREGSISLKTPFHDDIIASAGLSQNGFEANLEYARGKSVNIQGSLEYDNKIIASGSIRSSCPWLKSASGKFEHSGPWNAFTSQASFEYERFSGPIEATLSFNLENADLETAAMLTTPFDQVKEVGVRLTNENPSWKRYDTSVSATYNKQTLFEGQTSMKFVHIGNFNGDINLSSILPEARSVVLSFKHKGEPTSFTQNAEFSLNGDKHVYSGTFNAANTIEGNFELNERSLYFSHEGTLQNMRSNMIATFEAGKDITVTASISVEDSIDGKLEFNAPFSEKLVATVSHTGSIDNFRHTSKLMYGRQTHSASMNVKVHPNVICQVKIETPLFEDVEVVLTHDGILKAFQSTGSVRYGSKTVEATTEVDISSGLKVLFSFNTPFGEFGYTKFDFSFSGNVSPLAYSTTSSISIGPSQQFKLSSTGKYDLSAAYAHLTFSTPFVRVHNGSLNIFLRRSYFNFDGDFDLVINSKKLIRVHIDIQAEEQFASNLRLQTPIQQLQDIALVCTFVRHQFGVQSNVILAYAHGNIHLTVDFKTSPLSFVISLSTPYNLLQEVSLMAKTVLKNNAFNHDLTFTHNSLGSYSFIGNVESGKVISVEFMVQTPIIKYETVYARFRHINQIQGFSNDVEFGIESNIIKGQSQFNWDSITQGTVYMQTPFSICKDFVLTLEQEGNIDNFNAEITININRKSQLEAQAYLKTAEGVQAGVNVITKFGSHSVSLCHTGSLSSKMSTAGIVQYPGGKINIDLDLVTKPSVTGSLRIKSPFSYMRDMIISGKYKSNRHKLNVGATFDHDIVGNINGEFDIIVFPTVSGQVSLETPFEAVRSVLMKFSHASESGRYQAEAEASYNNNKYSAIGKLNMDSMEGSIEINTPIESLREVKLDLSQEGSKTSAFMAYNRQQLFQADGTFTQNPMQASVIITTTSDYLRSLELETSHSSTVHGMTSSGSLKYNGQKMISSDMNLRLFPNIEGTIQISTASPRLKTFVGQIQHQGDWKSFRSHAEINLNNHHQIVGAFNFSVNPLMGKVSLKTPYAGAREVVAAFDHQGKLRKFQSHAEFRFDYGNFESDVSFQSRPLKVTGSIKTPFEKIHNLNVMLKHKGDTDSFTTHAKASCNNIKWETDVSYQYQPLKVRVEMKIPFAQDVQALFSFEQYRNRFEAKANAGNDYGKIGFLATFHNQPLRIKVTLQTPIRRYEEVGFELNHKGSFTEAFRFQGSFQYQSGKTISISTRYKNMRHVVGAVKIRSPFFKPLSGTLRFYSSDDGVISNIKLSIGKQSISGNFDLKLSHGQPSLRAKLQITSPHSALEYIGINFKVDYEKSHATLNTNIVVSFQEGKANVSTSCQFFDKHNLQLTISMNSPYNDLSFQFTSKGTIGNIGYLSHIKSGSDILNGSLDINTIHGLKLNGRLTTPIEGYKELACSVEHEGSASNFKSNGFLKKGEKTISGNIDFQNDQQIILNTKVTTPFSGFSEGKVFINHASNCYRFRTNVQTSINQKEPTTMHINFVNEHELRVSIDANCPYAEDVSFTFSHAGLANSFSTEANIKNRDKESTMKISFQKNNGLNFTVKAASPYLDHPIVFTVAHEGVLQKFYTRASFNNSRAFATWHYIQGSLSGQVSFESSYTKKIEAEMNFKGDKANFETSGVLSYAGNIKMEGYMKYSSHKGLPTNIRATLKSPFSRIIILNIRSAITRGRYSSTGMFVFGQQTITFQGAATFADSDDRMEISGNVNIQTPFSAIRSLGLTVEHDHGSLHLNNKLSMKINKQKLIDTEVQYANNAGRLNVKEPHLASARINLNTASPSDNFQIELLNKDDRTYNQTSRSVSLRTVSSSRTMVFSADLLKSETAFSHKASFVWDAKKAKEVSYQIEVNDKSRGSQHIYDALVSITTPIRSMELIGSHNDDSRTFSSSVTWKWDSARDESRRVTLTNTYQLVGSNQHTHEVIMSHPALSKDITLRNVLTLKDEDIIFSGRSELSYSSDARENIVISSKLEGRNMNYSMSFELSNPINTIDISFAGHAASSDSKILGSMKIKYMNVHQNINNYNLFGEIQKIRRAIKLLVSIPGKTRQLIAEVTPNANGYSAIIAAKDDNQEIFQVSGELNVEFFSIDASYHPGSAINIIGCCNSPINVKIEVYPEKGGIQKPKMTPDSKAKLASVFYCTKCQASRHLENLSSSIAAELQAKYNIIRKNVPFTNSFEMFSDADIARAHQDTQVVYGAWRKMFNSDEFYMKTIYRSVGKTARPITEWVEEMYPGVVDILVHYYHDFHIKSGDWYKSAQHIILAVINKIHQWANTQMSRYKAIYNGHIYKTVEEIVSVLSFPIKACKKYFLEVIPYDEIDAYLELLANYIYQYKIKLRTVITQSKIYFNSLMETLGGYNLLHPLYHAYIKVVEKVKSIYTRHSRLLNNPVLALIEYIQEGNETYLLRVVSKLIAKIRLVYHYLYENNLLYPVNQSMAYFAKFINNFAKFMINDYFGLEHDRLMVYKPRGGELEFELYVPTDMPTFRFPIEIEDIYALYGYGKETINYLYESLPNSHDSWIPPFDAHALISGDQHIITFDKRFYNFAGGCDYVLASDFVDGNFTIIANYEIGRRTGITVVTNEQEIKISQVPKVNGEETELPYEYQTTTVIRSGDTIRLDSKLGFTVTCDILQNFCSVNMSGWYFGKTAGLLGTYTNEVTDDFITADQKITNDVAEFAQSWAVGRCRDNTNYASAVSQIENSKCEAFFKSDDSSLRKCFKVIAPDHFYRMCLSDAHQQAGECSSAALYRLVCSQEGEVDVDMPIECSTCAKPVSGVMAIDEEMTITVPPQSADVVFVVEEKACNMDAATKLYSLATKIDLELHNKGLKNTRFGLVGYGGNGIHAKPHTHTLGGKMFEDARKLNSAFQSLKMQGNGASDTLGALSAAAEYPFRMRVSKSIILVTCGVCDDASIKYEDAAKFFGDIDITLHVLSEYEFTMESWKHTPNTNYLFGIDSKTAYTVRHVSDSELIGDEDLFAQLSEPESQCADLAQETGGSFFNIKKLIEGRVRFQKSFVDIFSRRVAKNAVPASCQVCECQLSNSGVGQTVCVPCRKNINIY